MHAIYYIPAHARTHINELKSTHSHTLTQTLTFECIHVHIYTHSNTQSHKHAQATSLTAPLQQDKSRMQQEAHKHIPGLLPAQSSTNGVPSHLTPPSVHLTQPNGIPRPPIPPNCPMPAGYVFPHNASNLVYANVEPLNVRTV